MANTGTYGYTTTEYRGVQLRNCQILKFQQFTELDSAGVNLKRIQHRLRVVGYFTQQYTFPRSAGGTGIHVESEMPKGDFGTFPQMLPGSAAEPNQASSQMHRLLHPYLMCPRGNLKLTFNDAPGSTDPHVLFDIGPPPAAYEDGEGDDQLMTINHDMAGGPKPVDLDVTHVAGNNTWRVEWEVEFTTLPRCPLGSDDTTPLTDLDPETNLLTQFGTDQLTTSEFDHSNHAAYGVLSNKWSSIDSVNENGYLTRTIRGEIELANPGWNPHDYRFLTMPPLHPGMRQKSLNFTASADGLNLGYEIMDEEVTFSAPGNATNFDLDYREKSSLTSPNVVLFNAQCTVQGDRTTSRFEMIAIAASLIDGKILLTELLQPGADKFAVIVDAVELASHDATDQRNQISLAMGGQRTVQNWNPARPMDNQPDHLRWMNQTVATRPTATGTTGSVLQFYNNQRSKGNRVERDAGGNIVGYEERLPEGPISSLSALSAALQGRCRDNLGVHVSASEQLGATNRGIKATRQARMMTTADPANTFNYDPDNLWPSSALVSIVETFTTSPDTQFSASHKDQMYTRYKIMSHYPSDMMTYQLPLADTSQSFGAAAGVTASVVAIGPPQARRVLRIEAERYNGPPRLPAGTPVVQEAGTTQSVEEARTAILEREETQFMNPEAAIDGLGLIYRAAVTLYYNYTRPPDILRTGIPDSHAAASQTETLGGTPNTTLDLYRFTRGTLFSADWDVTK